VQQAPPQPRPRRRMSTTRTAPAIYDQLEWTDSMTGKPLRVASPMRTVRTRKKGSRGCRLTGKLGSQPRAVHNRVAACRSRISYAHPRRPRQCWPRARETGRPPSGPFRQDGIGSHSPARNTFSEHPHSRRQYRHDDLDRRNTVERLTEWHRTEARR
jgi:hypothetical protein